jgi:hypothetical protein
MRMDKDRVEERREQYRELLEELRTIIPGAQVLFAFLLTAPFAARFAGVDRLGRIVFTASLLTVTAATILFLAPAAYHRTAGRLDRPARLRFGVTTTLAGLGLLALSIACAVFVVVRFVFDNAAIGVAARCPYRRLRSSCGTCFRGGGEGSGGGRESCAVPGSPAGDRKRSRNIGTLLSNLVSVRPGGTGTGEASSAMARATRYRRNAKAPSTSGLMSAPTGERSRDRHVRLAGLQTDTTPSLSVVRRAEPARVRSSRSGSASARSARRNPVVSRLIAGVQEES